MILDKENFKKNKEENKNNKEKNNEIIKIIDEIEKNIEENKLLRSEISPYSSDFGLFYHLAFTQTGDLRKSLEIADELYLRSIKKTIHELNKRKEKNLKKQIEDFWQEKKFPNLIFTEKELDILSPFEKSLYEEIVIKSNWWDLKEGESIIPVDKLVMVIPRHIASFLTDEYYFNLLALKNNLYPVWFTYVLDKFVDKNFEKLFFLMPKILIKIGKKGGLEVANINIVESISNFNGKSFLSIKTLWNENLVNFHHRINRLIFPKSKIVDISLKLKQFKNAKDYYLWYLSLFIAHNAILFEDFHFDEFEIKTFYEKVVKPALYELKKNGFPLPLIVKIPNKKWSNIGDLRILEIEKIFPNLSDSVLKKIISIKKSNK